MTQTAATREWAQHHLRIITTLKGATFALVLFESIQPLKDGLLEALSEQRESNAELGAALEQLESNADALIEADSDPFSFFKELFIEMVLTRSVDHFEQYLSDICVRVFRSHPKRLGTMQITAEELLDAGNIDEAIEGIIERKVRNLAGEGVPKIFSFLQDKVGLDIEISRDNYKNITQLLELRNIIVHNARRVDRKFINKTGDQSIAVGEHYPVDKSYVSILTQSLNDVGDTIDKAVIAKFDL